MELFHHTNDGDRSRRDVARRPRERATDSGTFSPVGRPMMGTGADASVPGYLPTMRYLRGPSVPAVLFAYLLGLGLLLPEVGHSLAHSHASEHRDLHDSAPLHHGS